MFVLYSLLCSMFLMVFKFCLLHFSLLELCVIDLLGNYYLIIYVCMDDRSYYVS
jgi:hypothetical protein